jgi:hypothetical protein
MAASGPAAITPQQVAVAIATPWAVWVYRLARYRTFWLAQERGRCTRVARPSTQTRGVPEVGP